VQIHGGATEPSEICRVPFRLASSVELVFGHCGIGGFAATAGQVGLAETESLRGR